MTRAARRALPFASAEVPLYYQLAGVLREQIRSGRYGTDERMPTEAELVDEYGVSRITVRQALAALQREGLVRRHVGRGTFVNEQQPSAAEINLEGSLDDLISNRTFTEVRLAEVRVVKATADDARVLHLEVGAAVLRVARVRYHHGEPYCYMLVEVPEALGKKLTKNDLKGSILRVLEDRLRVEVRDAHQTVRASLADPLTARWLEIPIGAPLLSIDRLIIDAGGRPVQRVRSKYRSDRFAFAVHLQRDHRQHRWSAQRARSVPSL